MNPANVWKNFRLGEELSISGAFIYNGLRKFYELQKPMKTKFSWILAFGPNCHW